MQVGIYIICLVVAILVGSKLRDNYNYREANNQETKSIKKIIDSIDIDINDIRIEYFGRGFVSSNVLSRRGSWRMAQGQVFGGEEFNQLKAEEYNKKL